LKNLSSFSLELKNIKTIEPLSYFEFVYLVKESTGVITDSGGVQEETTVLGIPCITLRLNTERPETITVGTNELIGDNLDKLKDALNKIESGIWKKGNRPDRWDGNTSRRIVDTFLKL
jgi:UDP-N-acetylglucosamine 2-epimerase (non-hydrolysing)